MSDLKKLRNMLNQLEEADLNPTPIRRPPEKKGGSWVIGILTKEGVVQYDFKKKKWVIARDFVELDGDPKE